jgi:hypothetical protein
LQYAQLAKTWGRKSFEIPADPSILGGVIVRVGDTGDGSAKTSCGVRSVPSSGYTKKPDSMNRFARK